MLIAFCVKDSIEYDRSASDSDYVRLKLPCGFVCLRKGLFRVCWMKSFLNFINPFHSIKKNLTCFHFRWTFRPCLKAKFTPVRPKLHVLTQTALNKIKITNTHQTKTFKSVVIRRKVKLWKLQVKRPCLKQVWSDALARVWSIWPGLLLNTLSSNMGQALPNFTLRAILQRWAGATRDFVTAGVSFKEDPFPLSSIFNKVRSKTIYGVVSRQNFVFQNLFAEIEHMELARHFILEHIVRGNLLL